MNYLTIPNVELVTVGMNWPASTGPVTLTLEHLADAVTAAEEDPHVLYPRLKIGHTDARFNPDAEVPIYDPFHYPDGQPAFGKAANLRLVNDGAVIMADYVEVPEWLAIAMPSAFPSRSIEGDFDIETPGGKKYSFMLTAVALLGERWPAIQDIEDLERVLTEGMPPEPVSSSAPRKDVPAVPVSAKADVDKVLRAFFNEWAQDEKYWHWPRAVWTDPNEIIVDNDEGGLYRLPFSSDEQQNVTFGDPVDVLETFVDVAAAEQKKGTLEKVFASREALPERSTKAGSRPDDKEVSMGFEQKVRESLGLAEDATEEEVLEAAAKAAQAESSSPEADDENTSPETNAPETDKETNAPEAEVEEPVAASTKVVDAEEYERLKQGAQAGIEAKEKEEQRERDTILAEAIRLGKFSPARKDHWNTLLEKDPEGTKATIDNLEPGLVPVNENGVTPTGEDFSSSEEAYPAEWLPDVQARKQALAAGQGPERVTQEVSR